jgi:acetyl-CoA C-acetyltransferase
MKRDVYVVGYARTPIGSFLGSLKDVPVWKLGGIAIAGALKRAGMEPSEIESVYMGNVLQAGVGQAPARQASKFAGIPDSVPCVTVNKVCGSGMFTVIMGAQAIVNGDLDVVVAGGMESMSRAPYLIPSLREGGRMGNLQAIDSMIHDGLWDPYGDMHMGMCAEICAEKFKISREEQDEYAVQSYKRALSAMENGIFADEIVEVEVVDSKGNKNIISKDEEPLRVKFDKIPTLKPAFKKDGTVTAANASSINDGAAALILASEEYVNKKNLKPLARLISYSWHAQEPQWFTTAPIFAIRKLLEKTKKKVDDIDLFEVNEAFAVVAIVTAKEVGIPYEKMNIFGGAVALGHPIGCSGTRIIVTLLNALKRKHGKTGLSAICIGGGEALATMWEKI